VIRKPAAILALLTALNFLNFIDRWVLAAVLPLVQADLHLSGFVAGSLATVFLIGYFVTSPLFGHAADRGLPGGRKRIMAAGVAVWSVATAATGLAGGAGGLIASRAVIGVGEASYMAVAPTIIDDMAAPEKKGRWLSIFYLAIPVGSALGFVIGGIVGKNFGWRAAFFTVGAPGILAAALCLLIVEPLQHVVRERVALMKSATTLAAMPLYRRGVLGYAAQTFAIGGFGYWAPTVIYRRFGLPLDKASATFGVILVLAGGAGTILGGAWTDRWIKRARAAGNDETAARIALRVCAISGAVAAPAGAACFLATTSTQFFAMAFVCELALFLSTSPINAALLRSVPGTMRATAMAMSIFAIHLFGDLWSPPLLGYLMDHLPITTAMMGVPIAIATSAVVWWLPVSSPLGATPSPSSAGTAALR
jgi:MFS family permease